MSWRGTIEERLRAVVVDVEQQATDAERERCTLILRSLYDEFAQVAKDFDEYKPDWSAILIDLHNAVRKIENGNHVNTFKKLSS